MKKVILLIVLLAICIALSGCPFGDGNSNDQGDGEGMSFETAIVIEADNSEEGINKEYAYLEAHACKDKGGIREREMQELQEHDGHMFDLLHVRCNNDEKEVYYFQIDSFFGRW